MRTLRSMFGRMVARAKLRIKSSIRDTELVSKMPEWQKLGQYVFFCWRPKMYYVVLKQTHVEA